ncbi:type VI secretion protein [Helicobacter sp. 12S02232-10]|uniref:type VI secretion system baseplate subunit TssG n=1 Tax=Helicobacter sp. 12S02232-10 TaxID=1476197 RepID=UPI000BA54043|nr:type VI secretion system baseplate subunit TssG [Helicobacter sp. 12S02232-10]PAF49742.1 type VI secretion protein [Helicobacter sp. 12S02232-10]
MVITENKVKDYSFYKLIESLLKNTDRDNLFLRVNPSLGHPSRDIECLKINPENSIFELFVNFMGLHGNSSQLPSYILDKFSKNNDGNEGWSLFFDFFHHYLLWLFFDTISIKNYPRSFKKDIDDKISKMLLSMLGLKDTQVAKTYLPFASLIASHRRPKKQIERVLQVTFNLFGKIWILENILHQITINPKQKIFLGIKNSSLGNTFILGDKVKSYQTKIGVLIKDISYQEALEFLPAGSKFMSLRDSIIFLTNNEFAIDLYLQIRYSDHMSFKLGRNGIKLGWGSIMGKPKNDIYTMLVKMYE